MVKRVIFLFFCFFTSLAFAGDIFKSDTIDLNGRKISRIIKTDKKNLSLSFNGGGFKSFSVPRKNIAKINPEKLSELPETDRQAFISLTYTSPEKGVSKYVRDFLNDKNVWVRWEVLNILYVLGDDSKDTLEKSKALFGDPSVDIRINVCKFYEKYAPKKDTRAIYSLLWDENAEVRRAALDSLSKIMDKKSVVNAAGAMLSDKSAIVRAAALRVLFDNKAISEERVGDILINDVSAELRVSASVILLKSGSFKSIQNLIKALNDKNKEVRENAKKALDRIRNKSDIPL